MATERDELLDHNYDGIQEYDNDLPRWWLNIFWITTVFAVIYFAWTHFIKVPQHEQLALELKALQVSKQEAAAADSTPELNEEQLLALTKEASTIAKGKEIYEAKCGACHGAAGEGLVGPNLADEHWLHGGAILDIKRSIVKGIPEKGMIAWEALLPAQEIDAVTAFIWTLHGSNPPNPKEAQGEVYKR